MAHNQVSSHGVTTLAHFNRVKIALLALAVLGLAIIPNLPGFVEGLRHTAFLYTTAGAVIRIAACVFIGLIGFVLVAVFIETIFVSPVAVWVDGSELKRRSLGVKTMPLVAIQSVTRLRREIRIVRRDGGRSVVFSTLLLRSTEAPEPLLSRLRSAADMQI